MKTLIIRFDTIESWNSIERAAVNLYEQAALPRANPRGIRPLVKARQLADEIFSLIWRLSKRNSGKESWDSEARYLIRRNLTHYFTDLLPSDDDMALYRAFAGIFVFRCTSCFNNVIYVYISYDIL